MVGTVMSCASGCEVLEFEYLLLSDGRAVLRFTLLERTHPGYTGTICCKCRSELIMRKRREKSHALQGEGGWKPGP